MGPMDFFLISPGFEVPPSSKNYVLQHDLDRKGNRKHGLHLVEHGGLLVADVVPSHPNNDHVQNYCPMDCLTNVAHVAAPRGMPVDAYGLHMGGKLAIVILNLVGINVQNGRKGQFTWGTWQKTLAVIYIFHNYKMGGEYWNC